MGSDSDVMFTDGDVAMAAALRSQSPAVAHLLCVYHLEQNLLTHANRLFPKAIDKPAQAKFITELLTVGGNGLEECADGTPLDAHFARCWADILAIVSSVTPCPTDLADANEDDIYLSCAEELDEEDEDKLVEIRAKRAGKRKTKSEKWLAWEWLKNIKAIRRKWARCFVMELTTLNCFSTQRSESWHAALKQYMSGKKYLKELCQRVDEKRAEVSDRGAETVARARARHQRETRKHAAIINEVKGKISPYAVDKLLKEKENFSAMIAVRVHTPTPAAVDAVEAMEVDAAVVGAATAAAPTASAEEEVVLCMPVVYKVGTPAQIG
eukprot:CAMPEP_0197578680 /NCGR_PEP_ID=MMETSP1326-20131121/2790_1 /TAXON_ID=1155430 /ORGANISM="Genus nov. species nov., Strain RCC2288" /LENGTH=324 /DNA_ID=CAMNT_0043141887 /DNA_START=1 /DNA_END=971 /DNA_ORIENTATION=+